MNNERKMATIRTIDEIKPIEGADRICLYIVDGWQCVDQVGRFSVGETVIYCEVDSWIPHEIAPFLSKGKEPREYKGIKGERLKTIRLKGQISQGLLLKPDDFLKEYTIGGDVSADVGIIKWEKELSPQLRGLARGNFPTAVPKTDQERVQNLKKQWKDYYGEYEVTEKLEGMSATYFLDTDGDFHVCSRNLDLKETEENVYWMIARKYNIEQKMRDKDLLGYAIQGEIVGPKVEGNIYGLSDIDFYVYDVYDSVAGKYLGSERRFYVANALDLKHAPVFSKHVEISDSTSVADILETAEIESALANTLAEGIVFKRLDGVKSFKAISNEYLLKGGKHDKGRS